MLENNNDFSGWKPMQCSTCKLYEETGIFRGNCNCKKNGKNEVCGNEWCKNYDDNR